ncbi:hypothetical protein NHP21005_12760 [Helicobacter sp. NHP21005]|uniref:hypothetical protein n=1 Tax=Helicobacter felistomachi TaxID=3040201 RepID=UPI0025740A83|nr:hypothetical protein [Helicobacter sp. NHP21005]BEG57588.1 hypothetical protein NHP21005_12760 [Helicobacter sp. NHP21005]
MSLDALEKAVEQTAKELSKNAPKPLSTTPLPKEQLLKEFKGYRHFGHDFTEYRGKGLEALKLIAKKKYGQVDRISTQTQGVLMWAIVALKQQHPRGLSGFIKRQGA